MLLKMRALLDIQYMIVVCAFIIRLCSGYGAIVEEELPIPRPAFFFRVLRKHQCGFAESDPKVCCRYKRNNSEQNILKPPNVTHHPNIRLLPQINCDRNNALKDSRITGGSKAELIEFPWMALLAYDSFLPGNVQRVCLPVGRNSEANTTNKYGIVSGWGVTENGFRSSELQKVTVPIQPIRNCQKLYKNTPVAYKQICAGGRSGEDSCSGDSGGPLQNVIYNFGIPRYVQYCIISYGAKYCGIPEYPGIYTKVIYYAEWILDNLKPVED